MKINMGNDDSSQLSNKTPESITLAKETKESACQSTNPSRNSVTKRKPWSLKGWNNHKTWSISCKRTCKAKPPWQWKKQGKACSPTENFNYLSNLLPAINVTHTCQCFNNRNASEALNWHPKLESAHSDDNLSRLWTVWCNILYNIKTKEWLNPVRLEVYKSLQSIPVQIHVPSQDLTLLSFNVIHQFVQYPEHNHHHLLVSYHYIITFFYPP